ncbi:MAG: hypothetical protein E6J88_19360 [Deltaproteobacteria bacterium]|nr:MAG: hypothetical protein E6J88_19360 [Deltaproteobacteria bacterium]
MPGTVFTTIIALFLCYMGLAALAMFALASGRWRTARAAIAISAALRADTQPVIPRKARDAMALCLIQINLAEAEYNLGQWDAAKARLRNLELSAWSHSICRAGLLLQRAWIAAHEGDAATALDLCGCTRPAWLPRTYRAEYHFTKAAALLAGARFEEADAAASAGTASSMRASSKRNAMFLRAKIAAGKEDWTLAEQLCRTAAQHPYRSQGGDGLLLRAEALHHFGRHEEARHALQLVIERDPESAAAMTAASRQSRSQIAS